MRDYINANVVANAVRMGASSRRPRTVFLASDQADVDLVRVLLGRKGCRVIAAHSRENAVKALDILVKSGWEGVVTTVNTQFAPASEAEILRNLYQQKGMISLEGTWEDCQRQSSMLAGQMVRVTFLGE